MVAVLALSGPGPAARQPAPASLSIPPGWLQGYSRPVSGEVIGYQWAYPGQTHALLTRAVDGTRRIEWEGQAAPAGPADETVTYLWHGGLASGYGAHQFALSVNGRPCATFRSGRDTKDAAWQVAGENGCRLAFQTTRVGMFNELFGLMKLTLPRRVVGSDAPRFVVAGEAAGSQDYYMTFQAPVEAWTRARGEQARYRNGTRLVRLDVSHVGDPAPYLVRSGTRTLASGTMALGYNEIVLGVEAASTSLPLTIEVAGREAGSIAVALRPVRDWELHLLPHSHVDIGYSDPQPEVERKQWKNLRDAVALAAATAANPPEARFRWNVEGLWSVESYLAQAAPAERAAFVEAVRAGSVGLQANYTNILTGLCTPEELRRWTDAARRLEAEYHLPVGRTAMHTDIPGLSWTVVSALADAGVRYFSSGPNYMPSNPDLGDRIGHTLHALGDRPFWWVSPSGQERVLFWMAGRGYSLFHGMNSGPMAKAGRRTLLDYAWQLNEDAYPYDLVQIRYTIGGDNGPVDPDLPAFVKVWNEEFASPRIVIDTADAMFEAFERRYGARLPSRRGDMTPYWEDGAISTAAEEASVRAAARRLQQAEVLWAMRNPRAFPAKAFDAAWSQVLLWHEHTWGAADSISQPDRKDVVDQWLYKRQFAVEADRRSRELMQAALPGAPRPAADADAGFQVLNTLSWPRGGVVWLPADRTAGLDRVLDAGRGIALPSQRLADGRLAVAVDAVPALGAVRLQVVRGAPALPTRAVAAGLTFLDNGTVRVEIDPATGDIRRLVSTGAGGPGTRNLVGPGGGLGAYLYVPGRDPSKAERPGRPTIELVDAGPLVATLRVAGAAPGTERLVRTVTLAAGSDRVELQALIEKTAVRTKESAHLAFPLDLPGGTIRVDQGEALVAIEADQLPGSCKDFIGVTSAIDVSSGVAGVSIASADAPLFEPGAITDERTANSMPRTWREAVAPGTTVYAYLLNNYWHTNYKADQAGPLEFSFSIRPHGAFDAAGLRRFGAEIEQPLVAAPVAAAAAAPPPFAFDSASIVVSSVRPDSAGDGLIVRLYNASSAEATGRLDGSPVRLPPFGTRTIRVPLTGRVRK